MQMLLKWGVQRGTPVLVKSSNPERIASNMDIFDWKLDEFEKVRTTSHAVQQRDLCRT
jgi:D-xylose reductase